MREGGVFDDLRWSMNWMAVWCAVVVLLTVMEQMSGVDLFLIMVRKSGSRWMVLLMMKVEVPCVCLRQWVFSFVLPGEMVMVVLGGGDWRSREERRMNQYWSLLRR